MGRPKAAEAMSLGELDDELLRLSNEKAAVRQRQRELTAARDVKVAEADVSRLLEGLDDNQRRALAQTLHAEGVKARSAAGTPGGKDK